jgi:hypothetical protein
MLIRLFMSKCRFAKGWLQVFVGRFAKGWLSVFVGRRLQVRRCAPPPFENVAARTDGMSDHKGPTYEG